MKNEKWYKKYAEPVEVHFLDEALFLCALDERL